MSEPLTDRRLGAVIAGGAIATALFDLLIHKGIITRDEAVRALDSAKIRVGGLHAAHSVAEEIIRDMTEKLLRDR